MMKTVGVTALFTLSSAAAMGLERPSLPVLKDVNFHYNPGPPLAHVEPVASIEFTYSSCSKRDFEVEVETFAWSFAEGNITYVAVNNKSVQDDCIAPSVERNYTLSMSPYIFGSGGFVLSNPTFQTFR